MNSFCSVHTYSFTVVFIVYRLSLGVTEISNLNGVCLFTFSINSKNYFILYLFTRFSFFKSNLFFLNTFIRLILIFELFT